MLALLGLSAAVIAMVIEAVVRVSRRALTHPALIAPLGAAPPLGSSLVEPAPVVAGGRV